MLCWIRSSTAGVAGGMGGGGSMVMGGGTSGISFPGGLHITTTEQRCIITRVICCTGKADILSLLFTILGWAHENDFRTEIFLQK